jgi:deoxyribodipyrimidine photo-lyase
LAQKEQPFAKTLVWFRRDLRTHDHAAFYHALKAGRAVYCAFVFDTDILEQLPRRADRRVEFIWHSVQELAAALRGEGGDLLVLHGSARDEIPQLAARLGVQAVYANRDYEPSARVRDADVAGALAAQGVAFQDYRDQVIFEGGEVLTQSGQPFSVFTPYKNAWLKKLEGAHLRPYAAEKYFDRLAKPAALPMPSLSALGFANTNLKQLGIDAGMSGAAKLLHNFERRIDAYAATRDFPALDGPSRLSVHLRFGTVSIRTLVALAHSRASRGAAVWLSELIWRDFYFAILLHHPRVVTLAFRPEYDALEFENREDHFAAWCAGRTGYPLVDAAMHQINQTGCMHNRLRMVTASFLVKDLGIDWRRGEKYFADNLNDFDLAANNGGWQWAASTGCDAQPYFRIFNPVTQSGKFDPEGRFIRSFLPQLASVPDRFVHAPWKMGASEEQKAGCVVGRDYPSPIVDHAVARAKTLQRYAKARNIPDRSHESTPK